jgi:glutaredoxin
LRDGPARAKTAAMLDAIRTTLFRAITTPRGDTFSPVRVQKDLARRLNVALGSPLCSADDLAKRRAAQARLATLRHAPRTPSAPKEAAPVMIYFEKDRNARELTRVREALDAKQIVYTLLDVAGDEATLDFVMREAKCEADDLPVVFVAGRAIGGFTALVEHDVSGALEKAVYG